MSELEKASVTTLTTNEPEPTSSTSKDASTDSDVKSPIQDRGAKAWLTVFGAAIMLFCCGQLTAFAVFETWYSEHQLHASSPSTIAWIGSIQLWILYFSVRLTLLHGVSHS